MLPNELFDIYYLGAGGPSMTMIHKYVPKRDITIGELVNYLPDTIGLSSMYTALIKEVIIADSWGQKKYTINIKEGDVH